MGRWFEGSAGGGKGAGMGACKSLGGTDRSRTEGVLGYLIKCVWSLYSPTVEQINVKLIFIILFRQKYLSVQDRQELAAKLNLTGKPAKN